MAAVGGDGEGVAAFLEGRLAGPGRHVDDHDVAVAAAVQVAVKLVLPVVIADRPALPGGDQDGPQLVVGQSDEGLLLEPVLGGVAEGPVAAGLDLLLRLQPLVQAVPKDEVGEVLISRFGSPGAGTAGGRGNCGGRGSGAVALLFELVDAEDEGIQGIGPLRRPVGGDRHPGREGLVVLGVVDRLQDRSRDESGESDCGVELVLEGLVRLALEASQAVAFLGPGQALVCRFVAVQGLDQAVGHAAKQDAVARLAVGVDQQGQPAALLFEGELGHVAQDELLARGQLAQDEVGSDPLVLLALLALGGGLVQDDPAGIFRRELEGPDLVVLDLLARGQVEDGGLGVGAAAALAELSGFLGLEVDHESGELAVLGDAQLAEAAFADGKAVFLVALGLAEDDFAVAFERDVTVAEPRAVGREARAALGLPGQDVAQLDGPRDGFDGRGLRRRRRGWGLGLYGPSDAGREQDDENPEHRTFEQSMPP